MGYGPRVAANTAPGVLVANRGEVALRIFRGARTLGMRCVAVYATVEADAPHVAEADAAVSLLGQGAAAYLDADEIVAAALAQGCLYVHPGYGFLSESPVLARACSAQGLKFVGPSAEHLEIFGDKSAARALAESAGVPVLPASPVVTSLDEAVTFMEALDGDPVMVKATAGGGGRGIREVTQVADLEGALARCRSEAQRAFGNSEVYLERRLERVRHIEVQVVCDGARVMYLGDRDCSLQRQRQKVIEIAPAPGLSPHLRAAIRGAALRLFEGLNYRGVATVEFLVERDGVKGYWFLEVNPRLQVEHGVTEEVTGVDLVQTQLRIARGEPLAEIGMTTEMPVVGNAVEARITLTDADAGDIVETLTLPEAVGLRVETHLRPNLRVNSSFDPLVAKVIAFGPEEVPELGRRLADHLRSFVLTGPSTDLGWLIDLLESDVCLPEGLDTALIDSRLDRSMATDPGRMEAVAATAGVVIQVLVKPGQAVRRGEPMVILESMKMEQEIRAGTSGRVLAVEVEPGAGVKSGQTLVQLELDATLTDDEAGPPDELAGPDRPSLLDLRRRRNRLTDAARPEPTSKRHARGKRTARENVADLVLPDSFHEYGGLVVAAQRRRRTLEDLEANTPADGLVTGIGRLRDPSGEDGGDVVVLAYDYTVLAGTQGLQSHRKTERVLDLARRRVSPVVILAEGGGGRPGDTDNQARATGMDLGTFTAMAALNGVVPTVGIASGRCFAGNAVLLGCCDVIIATADATIGLGGPAMIEGGGLGSFTADEVGPVSVQVPNGVVDILVEDEPAATVAARKYLGYFSGPMSDWTCTDQSMLRNLVPEQRRRALDTRLLVELLCDTESVLELRAGFAKNAVTALGRIEGQPVGIISNDGTHLGGAIDSDAADKLTRFVRLCEAHGLPLISLCDTPGFMVGPESERTAAVRHATRLLIAAARLTVPFVFVVVRRSYGLGGQAMAGGSYRQPDAVLSWPTGDIGAMGPEGAARLGFRQELGSISEGPERDAEVQRLAEEYQDQGRATNAASVFEIDDVIDPAETRSWVMRTLGGLRQRTPGHRDIDTW